MPTRDDVKRAVCETIDRQSEKIVAVGDTIRKNPELGFKEFKTSRLVEDTMGLVGAKAFEHLAGRVVFFAVPAEEYVGVAWRVEQARAGKLEFLGGKPELLRLGHFDDVDMAMMIHTTPQPEFRKAGVAASNNGCIVKTVRYIGRASHAGGAPHLGVNALYAAHIGLAAINAIRETFRDEDSIRVHPIITHGGNQVNVIPGEVRME